MVAAQASQMWGSWHPVLVIARLEWGYWVQRRMPVEVLTLNRVEQLNCWPYTISEWLHGPIGKRLR